MRNQRNTLRDSLLERFNPSRDRRVRRDRTVSPEWLDRRAIPSTLVDPISSTSLVEPLSADVPLPDDDPFAPPPTIPPYTPPIPPGGPGTPK